jgi:hypothetical protein
MESDEKRLKMAAQSPYLLMGKKPVGFDEIMVPDVNPMIMMPQSNQLPTTSLNPAVVPAQQQVPTQTTLNRQSSGQNPYGLSPEDMDLLKSYAEQQKINEQSIAEAEQQLLAARQAPQQLDISPLIALAQATSPEARYLGSVYRRPTDKSKEIQALQEAVLKARGQSLESSRQAIKDIRYSKLQEEQMKQANELAKARIQESKAAAAEKMGLSSKKIVADFQKDYRKDYGDNIVKLGSFAENVNKLKSLITEKGIPTVGPAAKEYEALVGKIAVQYNQDVAKLGALAGADLNLIQKGIGSEVDTVSRWMNQSVKGGPEASLAALQLLLDDADKVVNATGERIRAGSTAKELEPVLSKDISIYERGRNWSQDRGIQSGQEGKKTYSREELSQIRQQDPAKFQQIKSELGLK